MKALILSGGSGTRLRPITHTSAKQLVPVANKPILFYALDHMAEAGIKEVGMIIGDTGPEVRDAVGDGSKWGLDVTYIPQEAPLGLAHCVLIAKDFLGDDDFVMYLGDNLLRQGVRKFVDNFEAARAEGASTPYPVAQILLTKVHDPERFGVAILNEAGTVTGLVEKPKDPPSDLALVGVYLFDKTIHEAVRSIKPSARGELEITEAIQWLIDNGKRVTSDILEGWWKDTGELDALLEGNRLVLEMAEPSNLGNVDGDSRIEGRVIIGKDAQIIRSTVRGPAIIGERTKLIDAYVGPFTSIAADCEINKAEIEHSMVLERSRLIGVGRIEDSLIGKDVEVTRSDRRPRASRLMLGDHSKHDSSWG